MTVDKVRQALNARLVQTRVPVTGETFPDDLVDNFLKFASLSARRAHYKHFSADCRRLVATAGATSGFNGQRNLLCAAIFQAMDRTLKSGRLNGLPPRVLRHQLIQFERILLRDVGESDWLKIDSDQFQKDFGLASLRLYAGAAQLIDPHCGVARSIFFKSGLSGLRRGLALALECGGVQPMFQIHTHTAYLNEFNDEGWRECYRVCADLYSLHPEVKGMFGGSWFYDPALAIVSPRLAYLSDVPREGGAHFFLAATGGEFVKDALATSPSRRKLHEEGRYFPHNFMMIWGRSAQIDWVRNAGQLGV